MDKHIRGGSVGVYEVRNEEVVKWLAVGICLAMVGMALMPAVGVGDLVWYLTNNGAATAGAAGASATVVAAAIKAGVDAGIIATGRALAGAATLGVLGVVGVAL